MAEVFGFVVFAIVFSAICVWHFKPELFKQLLAKIKKK